MSNNILPRRAFLKAAGAAAIAGPAMLRSAARAASGNRKLNVVMVVADDQRNDTIAALGNDHIRTPNMDRLAREGFAFTRARCMGSQQGAVCVPSRAALHTGRTLFHVPDNIGAYPMLGEVLQRAGYTTFGCGKWHNGSKSFARAFNAGGNIFFGGMHDQFNTPVNAFDPTGGYTPRSARPGDKFSSELFADAAIDFLEKQKSSDKPFFCYLAFTSPHDPRTPPPPYDKMYDPGKMPLPANFLPEHPFDNGELKIRDELLAPFPRTPADTRKQLCDYHGMISSQDAQLGRVLGALEETGRLEDTIVIYTGDHGLSIGSHGLFGKQNVYEEAAQIPLLIRSPSAPRGGRADALVYGMDLFPTICELIHVKPPKTIEGKSLGGILAGRDRAVRDSSFHAYIHRSKAGPPATQHAVNDGRWKYIRYDVKSQTRTQLFDLQNDPAEIHDLSTDPAAAAQLPRMAGLLRRWQRDLNEPASA
jgi:arylsulfatase A-like enzyme